MKPSLNPPKSPKQAGPFGVRLLLAAILLLSLALRLWGISDRLPDPRLAADPMNDTVVDEGDRRVMLYAWGMWQGGEGPLDLNPKTGDWPGLPFYLALGLQVSYRLVDLIVHPGSDAAAFARHVQEHPAGIFLYGRIVNVLVGLLTIFLIYRIGRRFGGDSVGLLAALLLACSPAHVLISQRVLDPNLMSLLFVSGAILAAFRLTDTRALADSVRTGIWIGLAAACKYVPIALVALFVPLGWGRAPAPAGRRLGGSAWSAAAAGVVAASATFAIASPFTFLDWSAKAQDLALQRNRLSAEWVGQSDAVIALPAYLIRVLPSMMTWPLYLAAILGSVFLWRTGAKGRTVVLASILLLVANGFLGVAQERFILPALGSLSVAAAYAVHLLAQRAARSGAKSRFSRAAPFALAAMVASIGGFAQLVPARQALAREDSRHAARRWIDASIPSREPTAIDLYGPLVPFGTGGRLAIVWPFLVTQAEGVRPAFHAEWLDGMRYYVTSSEVLRRVDAAGDRYALERSLYAWIRQRGSRVWASDPRAVSGPQIDVWALPDSISTPEARARLWEAETRGRQFGSRLSRWCSEMAQLFAWRGEFARGEEWARRCLSLNQAAGRQLAYETLVFSEARQGRTRDAAADAREGIAEFPNSELLHLYRAMALSALGDADAALTEFRQTLPLCSTEEARAFVRSQVDRLEGVLAGHGN